MVDRLIVASARRWIANHLERGVVRSREPFKFWCAPTTSVKRLQVELSRRSVLSTLVDGECDKQVTVVGHQFVTLTVDICVQHGGTPSCGSVSGSETC